MVAGWNGLAISALAQAAMIWNEPHWLDLALGAARYLAEVHLADGDLRRSSFDGIASPGRGQAEDFGAVAEAFALLAGITGDAEWLRHAEALCDRAIALFGADDGGFHDAVAGLIVRHRSVTDHVSPTGTVALVRALRRVGALTERSDLLERADAAIRTTWDAVAATPRFAGSALEEAMIDEEAGRGLGRAVAVVVADDPFDELVRATWRMAPEGTTILRAQAGTQGFGSWLTGRDERAVHVCRGDRCFTPVSDYTQLKEPL